MYMYVYIYICMCVYVYVFQRYLLYTDVRIFISNTFQSIQRTWNPNVQK